jgi:hypothetical protein
MERQEQRFFLQSCYLHFNSGVLQKTGNSGVCRSNSKHDFFFFFPLEVFHDSTAIKGEKNLSSPQEPMLLQSIDFY